MAEARLRQEILKRIHDDYPPRKSGVLIFGRPASGATGPGHPDLFGLATGHAFFLEIKMPKEKPTPIQVQKIMDLRMCGGYAWVVRSTLDASRAVYVAKRGGPVPGTNDPIDFDEWFKSVTAQSNPVPQQGTVADPDLSVLTEDRPQTSEEMTTEPDPQPAPPDPEDEEKDEEPVPVAAESRELSAYPSPQDQANATWDTLRADPDNPINLDATQDYQALHRALVKLDADLRTIGDRVTEVYEQGNRIETGIRGLRSAFNKLMADIDEPEAAVEEPEANGEVEQPVKRGRGRPRKTDS